MMRMLTDFQFDTNTYCYSMRVYNLFAVEDQSPVMKV